MPGCGGCGVLESGGPKPPRWWRSPPEARGAGVLRLLLTGIGGVNPPGTGDVKPPTPPGAKLPAEGDFHGGPGGASPPARNGEQVPRESSVVGPSSSHGDERISSYLLARGGSLLFCFCLDIVLISSLFSLAILAPQSPRWLIHSSTFSSIKFVDT